MVVLFRQLDLVEAAADHLGVGAVAMRHGFHRLGRTAPQAVHLDHVTAPHVCEQRAHRGLLRRDGDVDGAAFHQIDVGQAVDQRERLAHSQALGQHRRDDVRFVVVGDGAEDVGLLDVFLDQQRLVGGIATEHHHVIKRFGQTAGALSDRAR